MSGPTTKSVIIMPETLVQQGFAGSCQQFDAYGLQAGYESSARLVVRLTEPVPSLAFIT